MANLDEPLPPEATTENPEEKAARILATRRANMKKAQEARRLRSRAATSSTPSSGRASAGPNPYRQIREVVTKGAGDIGTGVLKFAPLTGAYLGGTTDDARPSARPKTPEERAERVGYLAERTAQALPAPVVQLLLVLLQYQVWGELAFFLFDFGMAIGLDSGFIAPDSWIGVLARRRLKDVIATLEEESAAARGNTAAPPNGFQPSAGLRWTPAPSAA